MPRKRAAPYVDLKALMQKGAQNMLKRREEDLRRERDKKYEYAQRVTVCVEEWPAGPDPTDPLKEPRVEWRLMKGQEMPNGIEPFRARASFSEAVKNRLTVHQLLTKRFRRGYRERLQGEGFDSLQAAQMSLLLDITVVDVRGAAS
jgi:hypothetical protein